MSATDWHLPGEPCRLGYTEYDGARYCFEHGGFLERGLNTRRCDRAPRVPTQPAPTEAEGATA